MKKNNTLINYLNNSTFTQNLKLKQNEINFIHDQIIETEIKNKKLKKEEKNFTKIFDFIKIYKTRNLIFKYNNKKIIKKNETKDVPEEFKKILKLTKKLAEEKNSDLYFIYLPEYSSIASIYENKEFNLIKNIVRELNIPFIDIYNLFKKEQNPEKYFPLRNLGHYNAEGYKKVAEKVFELTKN